MKAFLAIELPWLGKRQKGHFPTSKIPESVRTPLTREIFLCPLNQVLIFRSVSPFAAHYIKWPIPYPLTLHVLVHYLLSLCDKSLRNKHIHHCLILIDSVVLCPNFCQVSYGDDDRYSCSDRQGKEKVWHILKFGLGFRLEVDTNTTELFRYTYYVIKPTTPWRTSFYAQKFHQFTVRRIHKIRVQVF
jgi:hypothetical protein